MSVEENKASMRRFVEECINGKNLGALDQYITADFVDHSAPPGTPPGLEGARQTFSMIMDAFPDFRVTIDDLVAEGDQVAGRATAQGTHRGEFMGMQPTGKRFEIAEMHIIRMAGGKMAEHWESSDQLGMMQQLGVIPAQG